MALTKTQVSQLYVSLFGRASEGAGNTYWQTQNAANADTNINRTNTATEMLNLAVVKTYFGVTDYATTANVQTVVEAIYLNTLGKTYAQDTVGVDYWVAAVAGGTSMGSMVNSLIIAINAPANRVAAADIAASNTFNNKVSVSDYTADNLSALTTTTIFAAYLTGVTDAASTVVTAKAAALADVPAVANPGSAFALTTSSDTLVGTAADDTFTSGIILGVDSFGVGDTVNGGAGNDTLNALFVAAGAVPSLATVTNVETATLRSATDANVFNTTAWTGLTALNVTGFQNQTITAAGTTAVVITETGLATSDSVSVNGGSSVTVNSTATGATANGATGGSIGVGATTAATGAVTITDAHLSALVTNSDAATAGAISVTGGTTINVTSTIDGSAAAKATVLANALAVDHVRSAISITGDSSTTAATVTQSAFVAEVSNAGLGRIGIDGGSVAVTDKNAASTTAAGTITTVSLTNVGGATVNSGALTTLNLTGTLVTVNAGTSGALTTAANSTLALNLVGAVSTGAVTIDADFTTVNIAGNTTASTLADFVQAAVTTLVVSGDAKVTLTDYDPATITDITVTNTGGLVLGTSTLAVGTNYAGGAGADSVKLGAVTKAVTMGAGNDTVTSAGIVGTGGSVNAGGGTGDKVIMSSAEAVAADGTSAFNTAYTNFEVLEVSGAFAADAVLDIDGLNDVSTVIVAGGTGHASNSQITNIDSGSTVVFKADIAGMTVAVDGAVSSSTDVLNITLKKSGVLTHTVLTAAGVETINISTADAVAIGSAAAKHVISTFVVAGATTVNVSGNNGLTLTSSAGSVLVTTFDASGVVANDTAASTFVAATTDTAANLAVTYVSVNATANADVTITGGAGNDTLTGSAAAVNNDTIDGGAGADIITGGTGADTITGGNGGDTIKGGLGVDTITLTETTAASDFVVIEGGLTADVITGFNLGSTTSDEIQIALAATEVSGAMVGGVTANWTVLKTGGDTSTAQATIQEVADQNGGAAVAVAAASPVYVLLTETYATLAALETGIETGDHELSGLHSSVGVVDAFLVMYSDGTDSHVVAMTVAVNPGTDFVFGNLVATNLATIKGTGVLNAGDVTANNFEYVT